MVPCHCAVLCWALAGALLLGLLPAMARGSPLRLAFSSRNSAPLRGPLLQALAAVLLALQWRQTGSPWPLNHKETAGSSSFEVSALYFKRAADLSTELPPHQARLLPLAWGEGGSESELQVLPSAASAAAAGAVPLLPG